MVAGKAVAMGKLECVLSLFLVGNYIWIAKARAILFAKKVWGFFADFGIFSFAERSVFWL